MNPSNNARSDTLNTLLDRMQYCADPLADATITNILGPWTLPQDAPVTSPPLLMAQWLPQWQKLAQVSQTFLQWSDNRSITDWKVPADLAPEIGVPLAGYLDAGCHLPDWADHGKLERAEALFMEYGALSVTMRFCSSLPECYVIPDLAAVLHVTGQLEKHTEYRIRATGAMIFPVMMRGGLTDLAGGGVAQILKVRLIHATIRNLILRGSPEAAMSALDVSQNHQSGAGVPGASYASEAGIVPPLCGLAAPDNMHQALFAHGWRTGAEGLPCNQEELAYTLLTFSYVFLRSMRKLGLPLARADEEAYLHSWNVAGHILGIERELMAETMEEADALFSGMQARGRDDWRSKPGPSDPRPKFGNALMQSMANVIPLRALQSFPTLLTRHLCGRATSQDLGLDGPMSWLSQLLFAGSMLFVRVIDWLVRLAFPEFSIARFITRVLGYHLMTKLLMDQTRPLKLPQHLLSRVGNTMDQWSDDPKAPGWLNSLEDYLTTKGGWRTPGRMQDVGKVE